MEPTQHPTDQPSPTQPRPNPIVDAPATVRACAEDFGSGASVRASSAKRDARARG